MECSITHHNDHNYFEVAHTIKYVSDMVGNDLKLYSFVDNHDVERIYTKLKNKAHFLPVHVMLYTLPGVLSLYYGSEFGIGGRKERFSDDSLRLVLNYEDYKDAYMDFACGHSVEYVGALTGECVSVNGGRIRVRVPANSGEIWIPAELCSVSFAPIKTVEIEKTSESVKIVEEPKKPEPVKVQEAILEKMRRNGPVTEYMLGTVRENVYHDSLVTWVKSFL